MQDTATMSGSTGPASPGTFISTSSGGWRPEGVERPIYSVGSGPSMAPVAALTYAREESPEEAEELLVCDTGGTTFDVGLVSAAGSHTAETWLGGRGSATSPGFARPT
jgi:N-methylhydantoinase A